MIRATLLALLLAAGTLVHGTGATAAACAGPADFDGDGVEDVAVGDPFADDDKGAVHVVSGGKVVPVTVPGLAQGDGFGWSVRLAKVDGDACADLVVGAPFTDVRGSQDAGAVYVVYGGSSAPPKQLYAIEPQRDAHFGWSLAAKGSLVAIGAPYEDEAQRSDTGALYIREGDGPLRRISQDSTEVPGNGEVGDQFGWSLAMGAGNQLIVGVPYENDDGAGRQVGAGKIDSGSVVSIKDVLAPRLEGVKVDSPTAASGDRYGYALAYAEGAGLAVGAPGAGYVDLLDAKLASKRKVQQGGKQAFGFSLAASPDGRLAIGAPYGGGVRLVSFRDSGEDRTLPSQGDLFGYAVAFSGNKIYVGRPDAAPYGQVAVAGRNADDLRPVQPPKGADFGMSLSG
ncbi:FG-GAP and VCBS repeat-containing protein [Nonomuraea lactucae]|uniref:FG-GAP and VCBS repeat-containing protein n=1 Tax=Nonomuraea lactucae TaxID=2249762 RepID=UPI000DE2A039|nr:FG-GAP and VCBS repeat-containing protein [Nonomuraea lactucae]